MKTALVLLCAMVTAFTISGRPVAIWTYEELANKADLVVIGKPVTTTNTAEKIVLLGAQVSGWETEFEVRLLIKGDKNLKRIVFHHYLVSDAQLVPDGPNLVSFDPKERRCFLLFLHKEPDRRYAPITGQTDPALASVVKLEGGPCSFEVGK